MSAALPAPIGEMTRTGLVGQLGSVTCERAVSAASNAMAASGAAKVTASAVTRVAVANTLPDQLASWALFRIACTSMPNWLHFETLFREPTRY
jgi:hypothetical protein